VHLNNLNAPVLNVLRAVPVCGYGGLYNGSPPRKRRDFAIKYSDYLQFLLPEVIFP